MLAAELARATQGRESGNMNLGNNPEAWEKNRQAGWYYDVATESWQNEDPNAPMYARGGDHLGGMRLVGELGPELELTGPSRILSTKTITDALSAGGNVAA